MKNIEIWNKWIATKGFSNTKKEKLDQLFNFIDSNFPDLTLEIKWNQPIFTLNNVFIIGFSACQPHISIAPENLALLGFKKQFEANNYEYTENIIKIKYSQNIDFNLIKEMIEFQINRKQSSKKFFS